MTEFCGKAKGSNKCLILGRSRDFPTTGPCTLCLPSPTTTMSKKHINNTTFAHGRNFRPKPNATLFSQVGERYESMSRSRLLRAYYLTRGVLEEVQMIQVDYDFTREIFCWSYIYFQGKEGCVKEFLYLVNAFSLNYLREFCKL